MSVECDSCKATVPNYECLAQHYLNAHHDNYRAKYAGKCRFCTASNPQNIDKHRRYRTPEDLKKHESENHKSQEQTLKAKCVHCSKELNYYFGLSEHDDEYRAKYCGICVLLFPYQYMT